MREHFRRLGPLTQLVEQGTGRIEVRLGRSRAMATAMRCFSRPASAATSGKARRGGGYTSAAFGPLAQLVEQGTLNPKVAGSIPARPTPKTPLTRRFAFRRARRMTELR